MLRDTGFDLHVDTRVESFGDRPSNEHIEKIKTALFDTAKKLNYELGPLSEKWFLDNGWLWVMGANHA